MTYKIRVDIVKNRLYVTLIGFPSLDEMQRCGDETIEATRRLRPGYDIITDITQFKAGGPDVAKDIERVQAHFQASGARQGVRVVGERALSGLQFSRTGKLAGYNSINVATVAEAEALLDRP
jgi:hypothetical protein